jgi:hypothetical protein
MMVLAASRSGALGSGHGGVCGHILVPPGHLLVEIFVTHYCASRGAPAA